MSEHGKQFGQANPPVNCLPARAYARTQVHAKVGNVDLAGRGDGECSRRGFRGCQSSDAGNCARVTSCPCCAANPKMARSVGLYRSRRQPAPQDRDENPPPRWRADRLGSVWSTFALVVGHEIVSPDFTSLVVLLHGLLDRLSAELGGTEGATITVERVTPDGVELTVLAATGVGSVLVPRN